MKMFYTLLAAIALTTVALPTANAADNVDLALPCKVDTSGTVNDVQACANWGIDYGQLWAEWTINTAQDALDDVCDVVCNQLEL